ncbi:hypothetical protein SUGI_0088450 [Cryptomeria japonica]|uniref:defensin Tk-AMP-D2 n=1 Tax=Cryptomeria japonica TaxID=3369 RepID=UPI002408986F|nr:defensin Tk-AMP-D2 [Cryptomeria japonica]GLJ08424.1 hypothetical protein SUGI_0088450 [Cryptomeria japonica]
MALSRESLSIVLLVLLVFHTLEMETEAAGGGRMCKSQSHNFKGLCVSDSNCKNVCRTENFPTGSCDLHGANRKCFCYKRCA